MDILSTIFHQQSRRIGVMVPSVVVSEKHSDTLEITEHPVEKPTSSGTGFVADHAYRRPSEVVMQVGFSGGGSLLDLLNTSSIGLSLGLSPSEVYEKFLEMQRNRELLDVTTGKRLYNNMLIRALEVVTDKATENVLSAVLTLRELTITETKAVKVADKTDMKEGVGTAGTHNAGVKSPVPKDESFLSQIFGG